MSHSIRDEERYYAIFQPSAYSQGVKSYRPHTRTRLRESRGAYGPGPANGYGDLLTYLNWGSNSSSVVDKTKAIRNAFYANQTYATAQEVITAVGRMSGQSVTTTPLNKGEAQYKAASVMFMIGMLDGISVGNRAMLGEKAEEVYDLTWYERGTELFAKEPAVVEAAAQAGRVGILTAGGLAKGGGANPAEVDRLLAWGNAIAAQTTSSNVQQRQELEEDTTLTGQAADIAGERAEDAYKWSCFGSRLIGVNTSVCPPETTGQKVARYATYAGGVLALGGLLLYAGRPYVEAFQAFRKGDE